MTHISVDAIIAGATLRHDDDGKPIIELATCGHCGRTWNDAAISSLTPTPAGRCPWEYEHVYAGDVDAEDEDDSFLVTTSRLVATLDEARGLIRDLGLDLAARHKQVDDIFAHDGTGEGRIGPLPDGTTITVTRV